MNYSKIYNSIIENRKQNSFKGYGENHHIIPKSLGGSNDKSNIVRLTAREHFLCHYLLVKIQEKESLEWYKMLNAFQMMKVSSLYHNRYFNSHLYEALRGEFSKVHKGHNRQNGNKNSQYGTMWIHNKELKEVIKIKKYDFEKYQDIGWERGRVLEKNRKGIFNKIQRKILKVKIELNFIKLYNNFITGNYKSVREFKRVEKIEYSHVTLTKRWKQLVPEFKPEQGKSFSSN